MPSIPILLYHNTSPQLYPEDSSSNNVLAIRFPSPVRIQSIRLIPEGVSTFSNQIGSTYPSEFTARVLLNTTDSEPTNALTGSVIEYNEKEAGGWEVDYEVGMPVGVGTRLMLLSGGFERLSISVYGYPNVDEDVEADADQFELQDTKSKVEEEKGEQDWRFVSDWAGGVNGLLDLLDDSHPNEEARQRALSCFDLLLETDNHILDQLIAHPTALPYLLLLPSYPPQPILQQLFSDPVYALNDEVRHHLPPTHPYRSLAIGSEDERRRNAWRMLPDPGALVMLHKIGPGDWEEEASEGESRLAALVRVLRESNWDTEGYEQGMDLLIGSYQDTGADESKMKYLARHLPLLIIKSRLKGSDRPLDIPFKYRHEVLAALLDVPPLVDGQVTADMIAKLARPYLSSEPYTSLFDHTTPIVKDVGHLASSSDPDERALARFSTSLDDPSTPNGYIHSLTPSQILSVLAPDLLASLSTARDPPFGISPASTHQSSGVTASASAFAGKVYSSHEFRTRESAISNNGINAGAPAFIPPITPTATAAGGGGLGVNALRASRPASKHVDEYAR